MSTTTQGSSPETATQPHGSAQLDSSAQLDGWERFWFLPQTYGTLTWTRIALAAATLMWLGMFWSGITAWFGPSGILGTDRLGRLVASTGVEPLARWQWSPLYYVQSSWMLHALLLAMMGLALAMLLGRGGRIVIALTWLGFLSLANRQWLLEGLAEIPLALGFIPLCIAGTGSAQQPERRWQYGFAKRMLQIQALLLMLVITLTQLAASSQSTVGTWFDGTGFVRLVSGSLDRSLSTLALARTPTITTLGGWLTVGMPLLLAVAWIAIPAARRRLTFTLAAWWMLVGILSGHYAYGLAIAALVFPIAPERAESG